MSIFIQPIFALSASVQNLAATTSPQNSYVPSASSNASEQNRIAVEFEMSGSSIAYLTFGPIASNSAYTKALGNGQSHRESIYQGEVSIVFSGTTGSLHTTKLYNKT